MSSKSICIGCAMSTSISQPMRLTVAGNLADIANALMLSIGAFVRLNRSKSDGSQDDAIAEPLGRDKAGGLA